MRAEYMLFGVCTQKQDDWPWNGAALCGVERTLLLYNVDVRRHLAPAREPREISRAHASAQVL